jgi:shikimate kinase
MAGVGKSTIGKQLAKRLKFKFIDVDTSIENKMGLKLRQIVSEFGEDEFVEIEEKEVLGLQISEKQKLDGYVISPGGSIVYSSKAMNFLKKSSVIVFLDAPLQIIKRQVPNLHERGIIGLKNKSFDALFQERLPLYRKYARITVKIIENSGTDHIIKRIIQEIQDIKNK